MRKQPTDIYCTLQNYPEKQPIEFIGGQRDNYYWLLEHSFPFCIITETIYSLLV
jgi:hypothetical protein